MVIARRTITLAEYCRVARRWQNIQDLKCRSALNFISKMASLGMAFRLQSQAAQLLTSAPRLDQLLLFSNLLQIETDLSEIETALPEIKTDLPETETAMPEVKTDLSKSRPPCSKSRPTCLKSIPPCLKSRFCLLNKITNINLMKD